MFTYLEEDRILFTCDFLGALIYASLQMTGRRDPVSCGIQRSVPWVLRRDLRSVSAYVRSGLDRLAALDVELVAPSHGPMLERGGRLEAAVSQYRA